eukprot:4761574-Pleurochrysis_carterae.AAC.1
MRTSRCSLAGPALQPCALCLLCRRRPWTGDARLKAGGQSGGRAGAAGSAIPARWQAATRCRSCPLFQHQADGRDGRRLIR